MTEQDKRDRLLSVVARSSVSTDVQVDALEYVRDLEGRVKALEKALGRAQWANYDSGRERCPDCGHAFAMGHQESCTIGALLAGGAADAN